MAIELAHAYVTIIPSLKGAKERVKKQVAPAAPEIGKTISEGIADGLSSLGGQLQSIGGGLSSVGSQLTSKITMPIVGATVAAGGLTAALGWKRLVSIDSAQAQLRGLGYTTEDVARISDNLVEALEGGMLTMGEATAAAASGMAAGVEEGAELTRYIQLLDAAVAGGNGTFDEFNQIFSRIQSQGALTRTEFDMIEQRMPGFAAAVQDAMGVSTDEMYNMLSAGEITTEQFLDVMEEFGGDMATEAAKSWEGMVSNTQAYIAIIGESLLGGVFEQSKESLGEFLEFLKSDDVQTWAADTGAAIGEAFGNILDSIRAAIDWWTGLSDSQREVITTIGMVVVAAGPVISIVGKFATGIGTLVSMGGSLVGALGGGTAALKGLGGAVRFLLGPWGLLLSAIAAAVASSPELQGQLMDLAGVIGGAIMKVLEAVIPMFELAAETILPLFNAVLGMIADLLADTLVPILTSLLDALMPIIESFIDMALPILEAFFGVLMKLVEIAIPPLIAIFDVLFTVVETVFNAIGPIIEGALTVIQGIIQVITSAISGDWSGVWEGIKMIFSGIWDIIVGVVTGAIDIVKSIIEGALSLISSLWDSVWGAISSFFSDIWSGIVDAASGFFNSVSEKFGELTDFVGGIPDAIMDFFSGIGTWLVDSGKALLDGFIEGITSGFNAAKDWVSDGLSGLRDLFPFSPAKEGPFSGRGWVAYSGMSLGETFTQSIADALHDGRDDVANELSGINDEFDEFRSQTAELEFEIMSNMGRSLLDEFGAVGEPITAGGSDGTNSSGINIENVNVQASDNRFDADALRNQIAMEVS